MIVDGNSFFGGFRSRALYFNPGAGTVCQGIRIVNNLFDAATGGPSNLDLVFPAGGGLDITVNDNVLTGGDYSIYSQNIDRLVVSGNIFVSPTGQGFRAAIAGSNVTVHSNVFSGTTNAVTFDSAETGCVVAGNVILNARGDALVMAASGSLAEGNILDTVTGIGINLNTGSNQSAKSNIIKSTTGNGVNATTAATSAHLVLGNIFISTGSNGCLCTGAQSFNTVTANIVISPGAGSSGVSTTAQTDLLCDGNVIYSPPSRGIYVNGGTRVRVVGNVFLNCATQSIHFEGASTNCTASHNLCYNTSGGSAIDLTPCPDATVRGNIVYIVNGGGGNNGIYFNGASVQVLIEANLVQTTATGGRAIQSDSGSAPRAMILGCLCLGPSGAAQTILNLGTTGLDDCLVEGCMTISSSNHGVTFNGSRCNITGCSIFAPSSNGIRVTTGTTPLQFCCTFNMVVQAGANGFAADGNLGQFLFKGNMALLCTVNGLWGNGADEGAWVGNLSQLNTNFGVLEAGGSDQDLYTENHLRNNTAGATSFAGTNRTAVDNKV